MIAMRPKLARFLIGAMAVIGFWGAGACAQHDPVVDEKLDVESDGDRARLLELMRQQQIEASRQRLQAAYQSQFEGWVSSQFRTRDGARGQLEMVLAARVRKLRAQCRLTDDQARKLELAGRGDIKRFVDRVEFIARTMQDPRSSIDELRLARTEMSALGQPARERLFGGNSLLGKTLVGMLDPQQAAAYREALVQRNREWHEAAIASAVRTMQTNLGLSERQRAELEQLLLSETRPPREFGQAPDIALVLYLAARIPDKKIRTIFDDGQWQVVRRWMAVYADGASGKTTLTKNGFVFYDEPAAGRVEQDKSIAVQNGRKRAGVK